MKVISFFDGMACGLTALKHAGIKVSEYHAFEIDKYAIQVAKKNHPEIIHHGSVVDFDFSQFKDVDLLIGGSPCQGFSFAGRQLAFDDPRSKLFFEFVRAKEEMQPKKFLLENVRMKKEYLDVITEQLGVEPILINSALVSAQNRNRFYWCNWDVEQPEDKGIYCKDIVDEEDRTKNKDNWYKWWRKNCLFQLRKGYSTILNAWIEKKAICMTARQVSSWNGNLIALEEGYLRFINPIECERLQTLPDNYTEGVSNTQRYKMLGNGWTVEVIAHLLRQINTKGE
jgi:DNA-cytosine methyltransferase